jgi:hypothetical protein
MPKPIISVTAAPARGSRYGISKRSRGCGRSADGYRGRRPISRQSCRNTRYAGSGGRTADAIGNIGYTRAQAGRLIIGRCRRSQRNDVPCRNRNLACCRSCSARRARRYRIGERPCGARRPAQGYRRRGPSAGYACWQTANSHSRRRSRNRISNIGYRRTGTYGLIIGSHCRS